MMMDTVKKSIVSSLIVILIILSNGKSARAQKAPEYSNDFLMDNKTFSLLMVDRLEFYNIDGRPIVLDTQGYIGKDLRKFWFEAEGEVLTTEKEGELAFEALYGRAISAFFDARAGIRYDIAYTGEDTQTRGFAVLGLQGLAPYLLEVDGNIYISEAGDISAALETEYDFPITQRLWGQPRFAAKVAIQEVPEWGVGSGLNKVQLGFRIRYELRRELAPYLGVSWNQKLGQTADVAKAEGEVIGKLGLVGGVRAWF